MNRNSGSKPLLQAKGLVKAYGKRRVVDGIDFDVAEGSLTAILGPSGCGKTTLLRMIAGFERQDEGTLCLDQIFLLHQPPEDRKVNTVFQNYALFPHMTVRENIAFPLSLRSSLKKEIAVRVDALLLMLQLGEFGSRFPAALSGGQQQRVAVARALSADPHLLLLDEPMSALDRTMREHVQMELRSLQKRLKLTFILVTHDQEEALSLADDVIVMSGGRIVQQGSPETIHNRPANGFVASFIGGADVFSGRFLGFEDGLGVIETELGVVRAEAVPQLSPGDPASLALRANHLAIDPAGPISGNWVAAVFRGTYWLASVATGDRILHLQLNACPQIGDPATLSIRPGSGWIMAA